MKFLYSLLFFYPLMRTKFILLNPVRGIQCVFFSNVMKHNCSSFTIGISICYKQMLYEIAWSILKSPKSGQIHLIQFKYAGHSWGVFELDDVYLTRLRWISLKSLKFCQLHRILVKCLILFEQDEVYLIKLRWIYICRI